MTPRAETRSSPLRFGRFLFACLLLSLGWHLGGWHLGDADAAAQNRSVGIILDIEGAIGPATADFLSRGMETAAERGAPIIILRMDTPGGLDTSMRDIIRAILSSPVPVATYVSPSGARAASAGTYILYASHVAAMAPGTNLGAATPVSLGGGGGGGGLPFFGDEEEEEEDEGAAQDDGENGDEEGAVAATQPQTTMEAKAINDAVAYIRSLAQMRGRNAEWAEMAVRQAASLSAEDALEQDVIDLIAPSIDSLLTQIHGRTVMVGETEHILDTQGLSLERIEPDWRTRALAVITNPSIAMILMMIGIYGLFFEFLNPGALYPGTIGAVCLLVALYALAALPLNFAGLALMFLGMALIVAEAFAPSFGILGIGGTISFVLGATFFIDTDVPGFEVPWGVIGGITVTSLAFTLLIVRMAVSSYGRKVVSGREEMIGFAGRVLDWNGGKGHVQVHSERWNAKSRADLVAGREIHVVGLDGLTLLVEPPETKSETET